MVDSIDQVQCSSKQPAMTCSIAVSALNKVASGPQSFLLWITDHDDVRDWKVTPKLCDSIYLVTNVEALAIIFAMIPNEERSFTAQIAK